MTDILGHALEKLSTPESPPPAEQPQVLTLAATSTVLAAPRSSMEESPAVNPAKASEPAPVIVPPAIHRKPLQYLQEHRRQAAAIVVAACIALFWFDDGSTSVNVNSTDGDSALADAVDEEMMLDEFDAIEVTPLREPAEPSEIAAAEPFPLTIPQVDTDSSQTQNSGQRSDHPLLNERIDEVRNQSAVQAETTGSLEFPVQPTFDNSQSAIPRSVRFTGRIQPLN